MKNKWGVIGCLLFLLMGRNVSGQQVPDHQAMMNDVWEKFDQLMYKMTEDNGQTVYTPYFPAELKALDNKWVTLPGYMVPLNMGREHAVFMLSVLPVMQCMFCGQNGIPPLVQITMKKGKARFRDDPYKIKGRVHLNGDMEKGAEIQLMDAEVIP